jgi:esterase
MNYISMAEDIIRLLDKLKIDKVTLLGHSMGGKIAMTAACKFSERVDGVITVDSAPYDYNSSKKYISVVVDVVDKLKGFTFQGKERRDLLTEMTNLFKNESIAQLVMSNMIFEKESSKQSVAVGWKSNMETLMESLPHIFSYPTV